MTAYEYMKKLQDEYDEKYPEKKSARTFEDNVKRIDFRMTWGGGLVLSEHGKQIINEYVKEFLQ